MALSKLKQSDKYYWFLSGAYLIYSMAYPITKQKVNGEASLIQEA